MYSSDERCKRQCADHRNYICKKKNCYVCPGICRGLIAKGECGANCLTLSGRKTAEEKRIENHTKRQRARKEKTQ